MLNKQLSSKQKFLVIISVFSQPLFAPPKAAPTESLQLRLVNTLPCIYSVDTVAWSPSGRFLATASSPADETPKIWTATGERPISLPHPHWVDAVAWSPNEQYVATKSRDKVVRVWTSTGEGPIDLPHPQCVNSIAWSHDSTRLATGSSDKIARIWTVADRSRVALHHSAAVGAVVWAPDDRHLAAVSTDNHATVWTPAGVKVATLEHNHFEDHEKLPVWSPRGERLATRYGSSVKIWTAASKREVRLENANGSSPLVWSPDGLRLAVGAHGEHVAKIWSLSGEFVAMRHSETVMAVAWSPDGRLLATGAGGNTAGIWLAEPAAGRAVGDAVKTLIHDSYFVDSAAWSPGGKYLITGGKSGGDAKIWAPDGTPLNSLRGVAVISSRVWSPSGQHLLVGIRREVQIWEVGQIVVDAACAGGGGEDGWSRPPIHARSSSPSRISGGAAAAAVAPAAMSSMPPSVACEVCNSTGKIECDAEAIACPGCEGQAAAAGADLAGSRCSDPLPPRSPRHYALCRDSGDAGPAAGGAAGAAAAPAVDRPATRRGGAATFQLPPRYRDLMPPLSSPDGSRSVEFAADGRATILNAAGGKVADLNGHQAPILAAAWTKNASCLATASADMSVRVWNAADGSTIRVLAGHKGPVCAVAWSEDESLLATASWDRSVKVWRPDTGTVVIEIPDVASQMTTGISWAPGGRRIIVNQDDGSGRPKAESCSTEQSTGAGGGASSAAASAAAPSRAPSASESSGPTSAFSSPPAPAAALRADRPILAVTSPARSKILYCLEDGSGKIVDAAGGELATLKGHEAPIMAASWTRCGTRLATASSDTTVRVWDATSGREIKLLAAHRGPVCAVAYSPDETLLATASWDRTVKVWQVKLGKLIPPAIEGVASFRTATIGWIDDSKLLHTNKDGSTQRLDL